MLKFICAKVKNALKFAYIEINQHYTHLSPFVEANTTTYVLESLVPNRND